MTNGDRVFVQHYGWGTVIDAQPPVWLGDRVLVDFGPGNRGTRGVWCTTAQCLTEEPAPVVPALVGPLVLETSQWVGLDQVEHVLRDLAVGGDYQGLVDALIAAGVPAYDVKGIVDGGRGSCPWGCTWFRLVDGRAEVYRTNWDSSG